VGSNFAFGNACLPVPIYNYSIMGFWDDLTTNSGGDGVYSATTGTAPNRTFYLEYRAKSLDVASAPVNFEFVFHEGSSNFEVVYGTLVAGSGNTATAGVEHNMQSYTQYSCNAPLLIPGLMLSYSIADCPLPSVTPTSPPGASPTATSTVSTPGPTSTVCPIQFTDVPQGSTFYDFIRCLACRSIINGYPDGTFRPNNNVTRGQLSKIVSNSAGFSDPQTVQMFEDVPPGSTFFDFIGRLASRGYINGYPCGGPGEPCIPPENRPYFRPNNNATRGQTSKIVANTFFPNCQTPSDGRR